MQLLSVLICQAPTSSWSLSSRLPLGLHYCRHDRRRHTQTSPMKRARQPSRRHGQGDIIDVDVLHSHQLGFRVALFELCGAPRASTLVYFQETKNRESSTNNSTSRRSRTVQCQPFVSSSCGAAQLAAPLGPLGPSLALLLNTAPELPRPTCPHVRLDIRLMRTSRVGLGPLSSPHLFPHPMGHLACRTGKTRGGGNGWR